MRRSAVLCRTTAGSAAALVAVSLAVTTASATTPCRNSESFASWLDAFKQEAAAQGISRSAIAAASPYLVYVQR
ncbi:MAG: lytic murein transglycosylase, partial [Rhodoplanes sp.]